MKYIVFSFILILGLSGCSSKKVESSKPTYQHDSVKEKEAFKELDKELAK